MYGFDVLKGFLEAFQQKKEDEEASSKYIAQNTVLLYLLLGRIDFRRLAHDAVLYLRKYQAVIK